MDTKDYEEYAEMPLDEMANWFNEHPYQEDERTPAIDEQRPTTDGKVKNTLTGEVRWPTWEHISEIEPDVGRNKAW